MRVSESENWLGKMLFIKDCRVLKRIFSDFINDKKLEIMLIGEPFLISGHPPVNADHIYSLEQHLDAFVHPCPTIRNIPGRTLPTASSNIRANLQGKYNFTSTDFFNTENNFPNSLYNFKNFFSNFSIFQQH